MTIILLSTCIVFLQVALCIDRSKFTPFGFNCDVGTKISKVITYQDRDEIKGFEFGCDNGVQSEVFGTRTDNAEIFKFGSQGVRSVSYEFNKGMRRLELSESVAQTENSNKRLHQFRDDEPCTGIYGVQTKDGHVAIQPFFGHQERRLSKRFFFLIAMAISLAAQVATTIATEVITDKKEKEQAEIQRQNEEQAKKLEQSIKDWEANTASQTRQYNANRNVINGMDINIPQIPTASGYEAAPIYDIHNITYANLKPNEIPSSAASTARLFQSSGQVSRNTVSNIRSGGFS